jgi:GT2 family glycosyltransferase
MAPIRRIAMLEGVEQRSDPGICDFRLLYDDDQATVQAFGASCCIPSITRGGQISGSMYFAGPRREEIGRHMKCVDRASMLVRKRFLDEIGLPGERYSLHFEQIDWPTCAIGRSPLAYAPNPTVYYKKGASIATHNHAQRQSPHSAFLSCRSRPVFTKVHYPKLRWVAALSVLLSLFARAMRGKWQTCTTIMRGSLSWLGFQPTHVPTSIHSLSRATFSTYRAPSQHHSDDIDCGTSGDSIQ